MGFYGLAIYGSNVKMSLEILRVSLKLVVGCGRNWAERSGRVGRKGVMGGWAERSWSWTEGSWSWTEESWGWAERSWGWAKGSRSWAEGSRSWAEGSRSWTEGSRSWAEESRGWAEGSRGWTEGSGWWAYWSRGGRKGVEWLSGAGGRKGVWGDVFSGRKWVSLYENNRKRLGCVRLGRGKRLGEIIVYCCFKVKLFCWLCFFVQLKLKAEMFLLKPSEPSKARVGGRWLWRGGLGVKISKLEKHNYRQVTWNGLRCKLKFISCIFFASKNCDIKQQFGIQVAYQVWKCKTKKCINQEKK